MSAARRSSPLRDISGELAHCSTERRFELLGQTTFFAHLSEVDLEQVNSRFREVHYQAGEFIHQPGAPALDMFVIAAGQVKLLQYAPDGREILFGLASAGDLVGALAAIGNTTHQEGAQAHSDCCLLRIDSSEFQRLLERLPGLALRVLEFAGVRLEEAREAISGLSSATAEQRIARTLLRLAERHGEESAEGLLLQLPLPQQDLAALTGTTIETVSRSLSQWRRQGVITSGRRWIAITDLAGLQAAAAT